MNTDRGSGRTTKQMQEAPRDAVFVWCNDALDYPTRLAQKHGRSDLKIVSPGWLTRQQWRGLELSGLVADHAVRWTVKSEHDYREALERVRPR